MCGNFTTDETEIIDGDIVFDNVPSPLLSGYVTLTNLSISTPVTNAVLNNNGAPIITVAPGDSQTVFVARY
ncbi:S-Ena type endospore appendage [Bacillus toyonensis]|uniref:S-Ena type endospore appendage n=1 Tax=Bacillus toyonensis TaxID=155322 RepID=UPI0020D287C3|nr:S-Ena type endospore appendage [Bacillus toyonensis]